MTHKNGYTYPEVLVSTDWVMERLNDPHIRLVEVSVDTTAYEQGHLPGAIGWNWQQDTQDTLIRDIRAAALSVKGGAIRKTIQGLPLS